MSIHSQPHPCACCDSATNSRPGTKAGADRHVYLPVAAGFILLVAGIAWEHLFSGTFFSPLIRLLWYVAAYAPVGIPVMREAWGSLRERDFFNEYTLMLTATAGAFLIGEYPEAVAVMLFYAAGELFQKSAVNKARGHIRALLDIRPDVATVLREEAWQEVPPEEVRPGETLLVKAGGRVPLDGTMLSEAGSFNTSALTGESRPQTLRTGEPVLAGMIGMDRAVEIKAEKAYADSSLARILEMVQEAASRKAKTELLIRRFAKVYTPAVFLLALLIVAVPALLTANYVFAAWLYRALIFLVISCPCALVISVPLGYFGGIGAASRHGILFKGAGFLDLMASLNTVVMDKTGTLTKGVFRVQEVVSPLYEAGELLHLAAALEKYSSHPVAKAIVAAAPNAPEGSRIDQVKEIAGMGVSGNAPQGEILAGNRKLMMLCNVKYDEEIDSLEDTVVIVAVNRRYAGYIRIADELKEDAAKAVSDMRAAGIRQTVVLSGDREGITRRTARAAGIGQAFGDLFPEGKVHHLEALKADPSSVIAFVGDGINDAPVLALADVGIAMGGIGSDAAIEVADVVIQTDQLSRIPVAIRIARATKRIVIQNIALAVGVKFAVMLLGALGVATMWEAVFADVGVALIAILNAVRILRMKF